MVSPPGPTRPEDSLLSGFSGIFNMSTFATPSQNTDYGGSSLNFLITSLLTTSRTATGRLSSAYSRPPRRLYNAIWLLALMAPRDERWGGS